MTIDRNKPTPKELQALTKNLLDNAGDLEEKEEKELKLSRNDGFKLRNGDIRLIIFSRRFFMWFFSILLCLQNFAVFGLVFYQTYKDNLADIQGILSILVSGTLIESAYIARIMVKFAFKKIDYEYLGSYFHH